jgi:hypothetical protein
MDDPVLRSDEARNPVKELEKNMTKVLKLLYEKYKKENKNKKGEEKKKRSSEREEDNDRRDDDKVKDKKGGSSSDENDLSNIPNQNTDNVKFYFI